MYCTCIKVESTVPKAQKQQQFNDKKLTKIINYNFIIYHLFRTPNYRTPNSRRNPFDVSGIDHFPEMSPNVFVKRDAEEFRWSIEHMSEMVRIP